MNRLYLTRTWFWLGAVALAGGCGDHHLVGADYGHAHGGRAGGSATAGRRGVAGGIGESGAGAAGEGGEGSSALAGASHADGGARASGAGNASGGKSAAGHGAGGSSSGEALAGGGGEENGASAGAAGEMGTPDCIALGNCETTPVSPLVADWSSTCFMRADGHVECWGPGYTSSPGNPVAGKPPGGAFVQISGGGGGICGLGTAGELVCFGYDDASYPRFSRVANWGEPWVGLQADGTVKALSDFTGVGNLGIDASARFKSVVMGDAGAGSNGACGLHANGSATCWPLSHVAIGGGARHTCSAAVDGTLQCWGDDSAGQASPPSGGNFIHVSAGKTHSCAIQATGALSCWGSNTYGEATPPAGSYDSVASAAGYSCASDVLATTIRCWGNVPFPQSVIPTGQYPELAAGDTHVCALTRPVTCFGGNSDGQATPPPSTYMSAITAGSAHTCGLIDVDNSGVHHLGDIVCWGNDDYGQATPPAGTFTDIAAGSEHTCALSAARTVSCWGRNDQGQATPPSGHFVTIGAGGSHSCAVSVTGDTVCWGDASFGQLQPPPPPTFSELALGGTGNNSRTWAWGSIVCGVHTDGSPFCTNADATLAALPAQDLHRFAIGEQNTLTASCALHADQTAVCWGKDGAALVPPSGAFDFVTVGDRHACGVRPNGTVTCWGSNNLNQLMVPLDIAGP